MKKFLSVIILTTLMLTLLTGNSIYTNAVITDKFIFGDYQYAILEDSTVCITKYYGEDKKTEIPSDLNGYTVTKIGNHSFSDNKNIKYVSIPDTVTFIDSCAFYKCANLETAIIPDSATQTGWGAFMYCEKLKNITMSKNINKMGAKNFVIPLGMKLWMMALFI